MSDKGLKKRIGIDACPLGIRRTGVANYLLELVEPLCRKNPNIDFFLYSNDEISFPNLPNVYLRTSAPKLRGPLWQNFHLLKMARIDRLDIFWGTNGMLPVWGLSRIRKVLTVHDLADVFAPSTQQTLVRWNRQIFQKLSVRRADACMAVSRATSNDMGLIYKRRADAVINPFSANRFEHPTLEDTERVRLELDLPPHFWLTVGTLEPRKNLAALIRAHHSCATAGLKMPPLLLAGGGGWLNDEITELIRQGESRGTIRSLGFVKGEDLPALYASCDVFLMPSLYEGFGMPILEAQMCGAAVVHGDHPSMIEAGGGLGYAIAPTQIELQKVLGQIVLGTIPLVCRIPNDPTIQSQTGAIATLEEILGIL